MTVGIGEVLGKSALRGVQEAGHEVGMFMQEMWRSGRGLLNAWGPEMQKLTGMMDQSDVAAHLRAGQDFAKLQGLVKPLNDVERKHVWDVLEGLDNPSHPKYADIAQQVRGIYDSYAHDAISLDLPAFKGAEYNYWMNAGKNGQIPGIDQNDFQAIDKFARQKATKPFASLENYLPHYFDAANVIKMTKDGPTKERILNEIMERGWAPKGDRVAAERFMVELMERPAEFRGGPLQHTRDSLLNEGYNKDLLSVSERYFKTAARRIEQAKMFGNDDQGAYDILNTLAEGDKKKIASKLYAAWAGTRDPRGAATQKVLNLVHSVTLLSTAGLIQPAQISNTIARVGWVNTIKAMSSLMKDWVKGEGGHANWALSTGATLDSIHSDLQINSLQDLSAFWLRFIGLEKLDRLNRTISSIAGRFYAENLGKRMMQEGVDAGGAASYRRMFTRMGLDADSIFNRGGKLTPDELRTAGLRVSSDTQFASSVLDLPPMRNTPQGRFMYLFKSFALQQSQFMKREIYDEVMKHGNWKPMANYLSAVGLSSVLIGEVMRKAKGREAPDSMFQRELEDLSYVGTFGAFYDSARAIGSGPDALLYYVLGPTASEAAVTLGSDVKGLLPEALGGGGGDPTPLLKHMVRRIPLIGQYLHNTWSDSW